MPNELERQLTRHRLGEAVFQEPVERRSKMGRPAADRFQERAPRQDRAPGFERGSLRKCASGHVEPHPSQAPGPTSMACHSGQFGAHAEAMVPRRLNTLPSPLGGREAAGSAWAHRGFDGSPGLRAGQPGAEPRWYGSGRSPHHLLEVAREVSLIRIAQRRRERGE